MNNFYWRTWAQVNLDILKQNIEKIRELSHGKEIIAVVKANAYGHGDVQCAKALGECGITNFAVSNLWEAQRLYSNGINGDILIFGYCDLSLIPENVNKNFIFTVGDVEYAEKLSKTALENGLKIRADIKIDTGMSRVGINTEEQLDAIMALKGLEFRAGYTHFAVADSLDAADIEFTDKQQRRLLKLCGKYGLKTHSQNSGGIIYHDKYEGDYVRAGIVMYGQKPNELFPIPDGIKPVLSLKTVVSQLKVIHKGDTVSYGRTYCAERDIKLALVACGYADGFNRRLSGDWDVMINGTAAPICGRICMDQTLIDVTDIPDVKVGDVVTIYSDEIEGGSSIEHAAQKIGTIGYELLCAIGTRVPRVYINNGIETEIQRYI